MGVLFTSGVLMKNETFGRICMGTHVIVSSEFIHPFTKDLEVPLINSV